MTVMTDHDFVQQLLINLAQERFGWRRWIFGRWRIACEPLRNDAARILAARKAAGYKWMERTG